MSSTLSPASAALVADALSGCFEAGKKMFPASSASSPMVTSTTSTPATSRNSAPVLGHGPRLVGTFCHDANHLLCPKKFAPGSALKLYLAMRKPEVKALLDTKTCLMTVLSLFREVLRDEARDLSDAKNPQMWVLKGTVLEDVFEVRAIYNPHLREFILRHLHSNGPCWQAKTHPSFPSTAPSAASLNQKTPSADTSNSILCPADTKGYHISEALRGVYVTLPSFRPERKVFTRSEVYVWAYINTNRADLIQKNNPLVAQFSQSTSEENKGSPLVYDEGGRANASLLMVKEPQKPTVSHLVVQMAPAQICNN